MATGTDAAGLAFDEQLLDDSIILAAHLFQHKGPLSVAVIQVNCPLIVDGVQFQIQCNRCKPVAELRGDILKRFRFTGDNFQLQLGRTVLTEASDLRTARGFSTFPLKVVYQREACQLLTFEGQGVARLIGPLDFPLDATMDDVVRRLQQEEAGIYRGLPQKPLNEIPIPSKPIPFEFQAPLVNRVHVVLGLPPNDKVHESEFPDTTTVGEVLDYAKKQFPADPARIYGAREDDEFDDNWCPIEMRLAQLELPIYLWIREIPNDKLPSCCTSAHQALVPLSPRTKELSQSQSGASLRTLNSGRRSGLNSPQGPPIIRPTHGTTRPVVPIRPEPPTPKPPPRGEPKGHDYGARLSELVFRPGKHEDECSWCFHFFRYDFDATLEALTAP
jgi:hypothetical protein